MADNCKPLGAKGNGYTLGKKPVNKCPMDITYGKPGMPNFID